MLLVLLFLPECLQVPINVPKEEEQKALEGKKKAAV